MKKNQLLFTILTLLTLLTLILLPACSAMTPETPAPAVEGASQIEPVADSSIIAEGRLVPKDSVNLSFVVSGQVDEVLVKEGDLVKAGDVLARLGNRETLEAVIASAEMDLLSAQQAYDNLFDEQRLEEARNQALNALNVARQAVDDTEKHYNSLAGTADDADIDIAKSQLIFAENDLDDKKDKYKRYDNLPEDNLARARYRVVLAESQKKYDEALRKYNSLVGTVNEFDRNQAKTDWDIALKQLELAQKTYDDLLKGPDQKDVDAAESRISSAKARLASAQADLKNLELHTPIDGQVIELNLKEGEQIAAATPLVLVADTSEWFVETDNLTEIDVVSVEPGQTAMLVPDAIPDLQMEGQVEAIKDVFEEKRGEITYTTRILVKNPDPRLRWGMTVVSTFER